MRNSSPLLRTGLTVLAAAALPIALAAGSAQAGPGISVSTAGSTVSVTTSACAQLNGDWGTASLLMSGQSFEQGRRVSLSGTSAGQSAAWSNVSPGTYTVTVRCSNNSTAGSQSVVVAAPSSPTASPTTSPTASPSPSRGVMGGIGGAARDYGTVTLVGGGLLVGSGVFATAWYLRRRQKPYRF
ncbi:MAG TPA: hypothetical protein VFP69_18490 [Streptomyces sp.]|nr:hypothetical protein [Streptomyces sp.]